MSLVVSKGPLPTFTVPTLSYISGISNSETTTRGYIADVFRTNAPSLSYAIVAGNYSKGCGDIHEINPGEGSTVNSGQTVTVYIQAQSTCSGD